MSGLLPILENEWRRDILAFCADAAASSHVFDRLIARHREPQRRYHGPAHLRALVELLNVYAPHIQPGAAPRLAVWWHDAIYDPQARTNEKESAVLARQDLAALGAPALLIASTEDIILATADHFAAESLGDGDYFLDADIAILGAPPLKYDEYAGQVREEYSWAPDDLYRAGRAAFLRRALARERLFRTEAFQSAYAAQAHDNMSRELAAIA